MKKSIIALAIAAGTIAAAQADTTTLYGSIGMSTGFGGTTDNIDRGVRDNDWDIATTTAQLGVRGKENLDNGLTAFYDIRFSSNPDADRADDPKVPSRLVTLNRAFVGLEGDFGKLTIGRHGTPFSDAISSGLFEQVDVDNDGSGGFPAGTQSKLISYQSPSISGLKIAASAQLDGANKNSKFADYWDVAANYEQDGITVGAAYANVSSNKNHYIGASVGYKTDEFKVVAAARHNTNDAGFTHGTLEGEYYMGKNTFRAGVGIFEPKADNAADRNFKFALGYQYDFSERTYAWVEGDYKTNDKGYTANVGIRHNF